MRKISVCLLVSIGVSFAVPQDMQNAVVKIIEIYRNAFSTGNASKLSSYLADSFSFMGLGTDISKNLFAYFIQSELYTIDEIFNVDIQGQDTIKVSFSAVHSLYGEVADTLTHKMVLILTKSGLKILSIQQPQAQRTRHLLEKTTLPFPMFDIKYSGPVVYSADIIRKGETMLIRARLEDKFDGYLILDSGAPITVIDKEYARELPRTEGSFGALAVGITGEKGTVELISIPSLSIGPLNFREILGATMDFSHISEALNEEIMGVLGADIISAFETVWDLRKNKVTFVSLSPEGEPVIQPEEIGLMPSNYVGRETAINMAHFLAFPCDAGGKELNLILDTGAGAGLITQKAVGKLPQHLIEYLDSTDSLIGATPDAKVVKLARMPKLVAIGVHKPDYIFAIASLDQFKQYGVDLSTVDGLIGSNYFDNYILVLNYKKSIIKVYRPT